MGRQRHTGIGSRLASVAPAMCAWIAVGCSGCGDDAGEVTRDSGGMCQLPYTGPSIPASAACLGAADQTAAARLDYRYIPVGGEQDGGVPDAGPDGGGAAGTLSLGDLVGACAQECAQESDPAGCTETCLARSLAGDDAVPSPMCQDCYEASALCAIARCALLCLTDASDPNCINCVCGKNGAAVDCIGAFEVCSGLASARCDNACLD